MADGVLLWIKDQSNTHVDPEENIRGSYKRGDIIDIFQPWRHGHCAGGHQGTHPTTPAEQRANPDCQEHGTWSSDAADLAEAPITDTAGYLVRVTGVTVAQVQRYLANRHRIAIDTEVVRWAEARRIFKLRVDDLPAGVRNQLATTRYYATTRTAIITYLRNKFTGVAES